MVKTGFALACVLVVTGLAFGTAQYGEILILKGEKNGMFSTPLESYFSEENPRPESGFVSSACWRGYIGTWEIRDKTLYLVSLQQPREDGDEIPLSQIFGGRKGPIKAGWFSGVLQCPQGKLLEYVHAGFASMYEKDLYMVVKKGKVIKELLVNNKAEGAQRSVDDYEWVLLGDKPIRDNGKWTDARQLVTKEFADRARKGDRFVTRGVLLNGEGGSAGSLTVPRTPTTENVYIPVSSWPSDMEIDDSSHVEVEAQFVEAKGEEGGYALVVDSVRKLKYGETIHHPDFHPPKADSEDDETQE